MRNKSGAIDLQHEDVVHHPYLFAIYELHHPLVAQHIDFQANASASIHVPTFGEKLNVERLPLYLSRRLGMDIPGDKLLAPWVYPLPFLAKHTEIGITLSILCHNLCNYYYHDLTAKKKSV